MTRVAHDITGPEDAAETVLLSSGLGGAAGFWRPQLAALAARYRVITYDQRGTGRSPATLGQPYAIADMADDVLDLLDALAVQRVHVVGHALGGLVGLQLAVTSPGRVASLAVVNGWAAPNPHTARCFATRLHALAAGGPAAYVEAQPIFLYPPAWCVAHDALLREEIAHGVAHFQGEGNLRARIGALLAFDARAALGRIAVPTWIAAARDDVLVPWTCSQALAEGIPGARFELVAEGGHGFTVTAAEDFNRRLRAFLDSVAAPA